MKAVLKEIISPDIDFKTYWPEDEDDFGFLLEATIGSSDTEGGDYFQIFVCTPKWIQKNHQIDDLIWGRHMLIALKYDLNGIQKKVADYCDQCEGKDWTEIALKLSRIGFWEFEDYKPY